jgi:hypothetical protein
MDFGLDDDDDADDDPDLQHSHPERRVAGTSFPTSAD